MAQLRHCATKVAGSIPDGVTGAFHSGRTMALGSTQSLTEISTRNISRGYRRSVGRADNLTAFTCRLSWNLGASTSWNLRACPGIAVTFPEPNHSRHSFKASSLGRTGQKLIQAFKKLEPESKANKKVPSCYFQIRHQRGKRGKEPQLHRKLSE